MHHVARAGDLDEARVAKARQTAREVVRLEVHGAGAAAPELSGLGPVHDQRARLDAAPEGHRVLEVEGAAQRHGREHGVELPLELAVLAGARAEQRELARLALGEAGVALAHPPVGGLEVVDAALSGERLIDAAEAVDRPRHLLLHVGRWRAESLDDDQRRGDLGKAAGVRRDDLAAHRVADDHRVLEPERAHQVVQIEDEVPEVVVRRGLAVAVAAQVECQDVEAVEQPARELVEGVRVVAQPVHDHQRRLRRIAPVAEVDAQRAAAEEPLAVLRHGPNV